MGKVSDVLREHLELSHLLDRFGKGTVPSGWHLLFSYVELYKHLKFENTSGHCRSVLMAFLGPQISRVSLERSDREKNETDGHPGGHRDPPYICIVG